MKFSETKLEDVIIIEPDVLKDKRGYFFEAYQKEKYRTLGLDVEFVQDNQSFSRQGTIRGLHYQVGKYAQAKLVRVVLGKVLDVAVDIRFGSPTFGQHISIELSDQNFKQLFIPPSFAHGFSVLSKEAIVYYKCTNHYSKEHERGIIFNDHDLGIDWKIKNLLVSTKDLKNMLFKNISKDFEYQL